jgi:hypothetical protein
MYVSFPINMLGVVEQKKESNKENNLSANFDVARSDAEVPSKVTF